MTEVPLLGKQKERKEEPTPFIIRGHHFIEYMQLLMYDRDIEIQDAAKHAAEINEQVLKKQSPIYQRDMRGDEAQGSTKLMSSNIFVYQRFLNLPENYSVKMAEGTKDEICNTCPLIGNHCSMKDRSAMMLDTKFADIVRRDGEMLDNFILYNRSVLKSDIKVETETAYFSDAPPTTVRFVITDAKTVKRYFKDYVEVWKTTHPDKK